MTEKRGVSEDDCYKKMSPKMTVVSVCPRITVIKKIRPRMTVVSVCPRITVIKNECPRMTVYMSLKMTVIKNESEDDFYVVNWDFKYCKM